jgi:hypothetical protein
LHTFTKPKSRFSLHISSNLFIAALLFFLLVSPANAYDIFLAWDPNSEQDLAGYVLYVDDEKSEMLYEHVDTYPLEEIVPNNPRVKITSLQNDIYYYFVVTAYDTAGNESDYSDELCIRNGKICQDSSDGDSNDTRLSDNSGGGSGCFISTLN